MVMHWIDDDDEQAQAALRAIRQRLPPIDPSSPPPPEEPQSDAEEAGWLALCAVYPVDAWDADVEADKLRDLWRAAMLLHRLHNDLHPALRAALDLASPPLDLGSGHRLTGKVTAPNVIDYLPQLLRSGIKAARNELPFGTPKGQTKWQSVLLIDACRLTWHRRTRRSAPKSINPASPFGVFAQDIFDAFEMGSARAAIDSWARVQSKQQEPDEL